MSSRRALIVLAAALALSALPARAFDGPGCGRTKEQGNKTCTFALHNLPLTVYAETTAANASVRVWAEISGYPELGAVVECEGTAPGFVSCSRSIPDDVTYLDITPHPAVPTIGMICRFEGAGEWAYGCFTGEPPEARLDQTRPKGHD